MAGWIALLRGINVGGHAKVPMAELKAIAGRLGWSGAETYIQSGNLVFDAEGSAEALEAALEKALGQAFGFAPAVVVRSATQWRALVKGNPFEADVDPSRVMLGLAKGRLAKGAAEAIEARGVAGERVRQAGEALWFHYPEGAGSSKITPAQVDKAAGSPVTARNWRTVLKIGEMLG
ncbi:MAG: DUF1697 domain-containing protein [Alphaproteobacteria bacterium]|nr:MAG: DUF1697 domain-containing protein [Alphaproteobacteria bacterium]